MAHFPLTQPSDIAGPSSSPAISALSISPSGALLAAADEEGTVVKVFQLRGYGVIQRRDSFHMASSPRPPRPPSLPPSPSDTYSGSPFIVYGSSSTSRSRRRSSSSSINKPTLITPHNTIRGDRRGASHVGPGQRNVWHIYDLLRGMTKARVEGVSWAHDERWMRIRTWMEGLGM
ncbi:hypothetical protein BS47DRAFT_500063 [Hydnum rufescens UP504]|uniref:Uncharacterized protein n=1 Tax=Hydnum rufescens UP504 TaxID=1448309 RepID=A0A9P6DWH0_9AGAM|nr:hypothetical protein BS47DRAFT_500063 [Hydnum rufescens UP504]